LSEEIDKQETARTEVRYDRIAPSCCLLLHARPDPIPHLSGGDAGPLSTVSCICRRPADVEDTGPPTRQRPDVLDIAGPVLLLIRLAGNSRLSLNDRLAWREQYGGLDQGRDEGEAFVFVHRVVVLQGDLGQLPVVMCCEYPRRHPDVRRLGISQQHHVLASAFFCSMMRAKTMLGVVPQGTLQVKGAYDLVASPL
jgi:hypothetical protein